jgi:hypothetical protein
LHWLLICRRTHVDVDVVSVQPLQNQRHHPQDKPTRGRWLQLLEWAQNHFEGGLEHCKVLEVPELGP